MRRILVFGVCAVGVAGLYLVPSVAGTPGTVSRPQRDRPPVEPPAHRIETLSPGTATEAPRAAVPRVRPVSSTGKAPDPRRVDPDPDPGSGPGLAEAPPTQHPAEASPPAHHHGSPHPPAPEGDTTPPDPVPRIEPVRSTAENVTLRWLPARDDVAVVGYRVWLDGFVVLETSRNLVTLDWFTDDTDQHVVQVKALDAAGNLAESSPNLLLTRPDHEPTPAPAKTSPSPEPPVSTIHSDDPEDSEPRHADGTAEPEPTDAPSPPAEVSDSDGSG